MSDRHPFEDIVVSNSPPAPAATVAAPVQAPPDQSGGAGKNDDEVPAIADDIKKPQDIGIAVGAVEVAVCPQLLVLGASKRKAVKVRSILQVDGKPYVVTPPPITLNLPANVYAMRPLYESVEGKSSTDGDSYFGILAEHDGKTYAVGPESEMFLVRDGEEV